MELNKNILEIIEYIKKCDKMNTSEDEFVSYLKKYDLADILEAHDILRKEKEAKNGN